MIIVDCLKTDSVTKFNLLKKTRQEFFETHRDIFDAIDKYKNSEKALKYVAQKYHER